MNQNLIAKIKAYAKAVSAFAGAILTGVTVAVAMGGLAVPTVVVGGLILVASVAAAVATAEIPNS